MNRSASGGLSRRTWLWTSTAALAAACTRPTATRLPETGAERARELTRRGAENLIALTELGAAIRWLHPSDGVVQTQWEPLLLDGVRSLEGARTRTELVEGLRGLFAELAPTVVIWRGGKQVEGAELDEPACPDPEAEKQQAAKQPTQAEPKPPAETQPTKTSPTETEPEHESPASEADTTESETKPAPAPEGEAAVSTAPEPKPPEPKPPEPKPPEPAPKPDPDLEPEDRPPLPEGLFTDEQLSIVHWYRRGYADGLEHDPGCARRIEHDLDTSHVCTNVRARRRERTAAPICRGCEAPQLQPPAPAAPIRIELPRALAAMIPLALWSRHGRTLPLGESLEPAPPFGEREAFEYSLDDRGTRLLAVLRTWSLLGSFYPHATADLRPLLVASLCAAAEDPSPLALRATLEALLAGFGDGNASLIVTTGKAARRFVPPLSLAWVEQRVVVVTSTLEQVQPGDVITAVDGVSIDVVLAEQLLRTPAASSSAAIVRSVAQLLVRERDQATIQLQLARAHEDGEHELSMQVTADRPADRKPQLADARPKKPFVELEEGVFYLDATRMRSLARAARRLRRAKLVIVDLRGELADTRGSLLAHFLAEPRLIATERMPTGPDTSGALPLESTDDRRIEPDRPRLHARALILADARTHGRAELELLGFDQLGATVIGSGSAGDLGGVATAWLPGGWQLQFTHSELRSPDGSRLHGVGVRPTIPVEPTRASLLANIDPLLEAALELAKGSQ